jgi:biopolymer transport protein TolR
MGMSGASMGGGGRKRARRRHSPLSEINVTPFVDVMLVLLIVFMVTAPLLTVGVPIDLPETRANPVQGTEEPIAITVDETGRVFLQETEIAAEELVPKLLAIAGEGYEERIFVRGDKTVAYGQVMRVMGSLNAAGFRRIVLVAESEPTS